jgi:8-hydroxy-5-deazaflavin:NADPH oxidoreductase
MKIGILGGGNVGSALGVAWARKGHDIVFGVRNPGSAEMTAVLAQTDGKARAGSAEEAAEFGEIVVNALPWPATKTVLSGLKGLSGKVLLDCSNPFKPDLSGLERNTLSGGEQVAGWVSGAKVVKVFNSTGSANMENPVYGGSAIPMFYCGDDAGAKKTAAQLVSDVGFNPVDSGPLANAGALESSGAALGLAGVQRRDGSGIRVPAGATMKP